MTNLIFLFLKEIVVYLKLYIEINLYKEDFFLKKNYQS